MGERKKKNPERLARSGKKNREAPPCSNKPPATKEKKREETRTYWKRGEKKEKKKVGEMWSIVTVGRTEKTGRRLGMR